MTSASREEAWLTGRRHHALPLSKGVLDAVFLDRDGTINVHAPGYRTTADFVMLDGAAAAIASLNAAQIPVVLVTNQRGLATGALTWGELARVHALLVRNLEESAAHIDDIRVCPHERNACLCRKPLPGMLTDVLKSNPHVRPSRCLMIGDAPSDADAAAAVGIPFDKVTSGRSLAHCVEDALSL